jgi:2-polyprenyl-3-methyl-5-hydroxy-6-metoxy-1,4-benzoquinol methylase
VTGIDWKDSCIEVAKQNIILKDKATWICNDYRDVTFEEPPDIIFSSLFCHHFSNDELVSQLQWMHQNCRLGFFINDLHRHWLAYHSIAMLTTFFSKSYLVKNDAPLSVGRGFLKAEWELLLELAGQKHGLVKWKWTFRHLILVSKTIPNE